MAEAVWAAVAATVAATCLLIVQGIDAAPAGPAAGGSPLEGYIRRNQLENRDVPCTDEDRRCFRQGMLRFPSDGRCYPVLSRGPCAEGQWLAVDKAEALERGGRVAGTCVADATHACPPLRVLMGHDQRCVLRALACGAAAVGAAWRLAFDLFGEGECAPVDDNTQPSLPSAIDDGSCKVVSPNPANHLFALVVRSRVSCQKDFRGNCIQVVQRPKSQSFFD